MTQIELVMSAYFSLWYEQQQWSYWIRILLRLSTEWITKPEISLEVCLSQSNARRRSCDHTCAKTVLSCSRSDALSIFMAPPTGVGGITFHGFRLSLTKSVRRNCSLFKEGFQWYLTQAFEVEMSLYLDYSHGSYGCYGNPIRMGSTNLVL